MSNGAAATAILVLPPAPVVANTEVTFGVKSSINQRGLSYRFHFNREEETTSIPAIRHRFPVPGTYLVSAEVLTIRKQPLAFTPRQLVTVIAAPPPSPTPAPATPEPTTATATATITPVPETPAPATAIAVPETPVPATPAPATPVPRPTKWPPPVSASPVSTVAPWETPTPAPGWWPPSPHTFALLLKWIGAIVSLIIIALIGKILWHRIFPPRPTFRAIWKKEPISSKPASPVAINYELDYDRNLAEARFRLTPENPPVIPRR